MCAPTSVGEILSKRQHGVVDELLAVEKREPQEVR